MFLIIARSFYSTAGSFKKLLKKISQQRIDIIELQETERIDHVILSKEVRKIECWEQPFFCRKNVK